MENRTRPKYMQIIEAAIIVIAENGFHQAQVSKIAKQAGVADGTIYLYFKNKEDILISIFKEKMGGFIEQTQKAIDACEQVEQKLSLLVEMHFKQLAKDFHLAVVTQLELRQSNKMIRTPINHILKGYFDLIDGIIEEGKQTKIFKPNMDIRLARQMIFGTLDETVSNWVMSDHHFDLVALSQPVSELLLNGLK